MLPWLLLPLGVLFGLLVGLAVLSAHVKPRIGLEQGQLRMPPSGTANCVCSEAGVPAGARVSPLTFADGADAEWEKVRSVVMAQGGHIENELPDYLWATYRMRLLPFVDDLELRLDRAHHLIQVRSASRVGHSDLGTNRRRVEDLRRRFNASKSGASSPSAP